MKTLSIYCTNVAVQFIAALVMMQFFYAAYSILSNIDRDIFSKKKIVAEQGKK